MSHFSSLALLVSVVPACQLATTDRTDPIASGPPPSIINTVTLASSNSGRVAWSPTDTNVLAIDAPTPGRIDHCDDGMCFDVYLVAIDSNARTCVTCGKLDDTTHPNRGQPAFHPSGQWIVFQGGDGTKYSRPGRGVGNDLWLISTDGTRVFPLSYEGDSVRRGVLHPHFSHDGTHLAWTEKYPGHCSVLGCWQIVMAAFGFDANGAPVLSDVRRYLPLGEGMYETGEFTVDDRELLTLGQGGDNILDCDIYALAPDTGAIRRLTTTDYNEHPHPSPNGNWVTWMSDRDVPGGGADLWIMDLAGGQQTRLTYLNNRNPFDRGKTLADHEWSPDNHHIAQYVGVGGLGDVGALLVFALQ